MATDTNRKNRKTFTGWMIAVIVAMLVATCIVVVALFTGADARSQPTSEPSCLATNGETLARC